MPVLPRWNFGMWAEIEDCMGMADTDCYRTEWVPSHGNYSSQWKTRHAWTMGKEEVARNINKRADTAATGGLEVAMKRRKQQNHEVLVEEAKTWSRQQLELLASYCKKYAESCPRYDECKENVAWFFGTELQP